MKISVVVPAYNAESTLERCLDALKKSVSRSASGASQANSECADPQGVAPNSQPPTTNHQPPTTNHQPPTTNHQPPTTNHQPPTTNHQPPTTNHQPPTTNHEIIVVDDGSTDRTAEIAEAAGVQLVRQSHRGAAAARNLGVREASGEIILFTDADCIVAPDWMERLAFPLSSASRVPRPASSTDDEAFQKADDRSTTTNHGPREEEPGTTEQGSNHQSPTPYHQPPITNHQPPTTNHQPPVGSVGRCVSRQTRWVAALIQTELDERYLTMSHHERIDFLNTGNCAFRRDLLLEHPFDETFRWLEDVELSFRLAHEGHEMVFVEDARVEHPHPESFRAYIGRKFHYASCAPEIYRRFPEKTFSDSRTPLNRRIQLVLTGLSGLGLGLWGLAGLVAMLGAGDGIRSAADWAFWAALVSMIVSLLSTAPVAVKAARRSLGLGLLAPFFVTAGNVAFVAGSLWGLFSNGFRTRAR